ncbi:hypothetical protein [Rudanella lutea]|jgi:hypothetical protein|uniref:hypothetical protein n=1 Tax=Rudanella lutea TaxID=451374 RepID=UPI0003799ED0|nr:hypothetical protein [Rudanella lutea]
MLKNLSTIKVYVFLIALLLGGFAWAGLTGTWLIGDDLDSVEKRDDKQGFHRSVGRGYRGGRSGFYHK